MLAVPSPTASVERLIWRDGAADPRMRKQILDELDAAEPDLQVRRADPA